MSRTPTGGTCLGIDPSFRRPLEASDQLALAQQADAVGHLTGAIHVVGHHQDRSIVVRQGPNEAVELVDGDGIEAGRGLVEQQDGRVPQQGQGA